MKSKTAIYLVVVVVIVFVIFYWYKNNTNPLQQKAIIYPPLSKDQWELYKKSFGTGIVPPSMKEQEKFNYYNNLYGK